jgi:hypothetical protein
MRILFRLTIVSMALTFGVGSLLFLVFYIR